MYIWYLEHISCTFSKIKKKSILKIFCWCMHQQIWPKLIFPAEYRPNIVGDRKNTTWPLPEKNFQNNSTFSYSCMILYFDELIWRKPIFSHLGRFGYKKASTIQKFLFFQNLQICAILSIYTLLGIFLASKKLWQLEARSTPF